MKKALLLAGILLLSIGTANADQIVKPHTFTSGTPAKADEVNADFDTVYGQVNKLGAAITVDGVNNVGIGTETPAGELHVTKPQVMGTVGFNGAGVNDIVINDSGYTGTGATRYKVMVLDSGPAVDVILYSSDDGATWSSPVNMVASGLDIGFGVTIGFSSLDGHVGEDKWEWSISQGFPDSLIVSDGKVSVKELAITTGAAAGQVLTSDKDGNATWQVTPIDNDMDSGNELNESFTLTGTLLEIEDNGGLLEVDLSPLVNDADADPVNELQALSRISTDIFLTPAGGSVSIADNDNDPANELQGLSLVGTNLTLSNGGGTVSIADNDNDSTNELITSFTIGSGVLQLSDAAGTRFVDLGNQLSIDSLLDGKNTGNSLFIGNGAGTSNGSTNYNVGVGPSALSLNGSGIENTALGNAALHGNVIGSENTAVGASALSSSKGDGNTALGSDALFGNSTGNSNVGIGTMANFYNQGGSNNTIIGYQAGIGTSYHDKSGNVFLGHMAGYFETGDNKLYIDNSSTTTPLLFGDFAADALNVNGTMDVAGNAAIGSTASVNSAVTLNVYGDTDDTVTGYFTNQATYGVSSAVHGKAQGVTGRTTADMHWGVMGEASGGKYNVGVYGDVNDFGATENYGVYGSAVGGASNYAGYFLGNIVASGKAVIGATTSSYNDVALEVKGRQTDKVAGYFSNPDNDWQGTALVGEMTATTARTANDYHTGVGGRAAGGKNNFGIDSFVDDAGATNNYGLLASVTGGGSAYGVRAEVVGAANQYAVYGVAPVTANSYAGYFSGNLHVSNNITYVGTLTDVSDERLKENIKPVENALEKVAAINGVYFNMKENPDQIEVGVIAQDVQKILPEAVRVVDHENGYLGVSYTSLVPVLIEAMKEQQGQINLLVTENAAFKALLCLDHPEAAVCH